MFPIGRHFMNTYNFCLNSRRYAGHSKWANIKHIKALKDTEKSQTFARLSRLIRFAVQDGGSADPNFNFKLAQVVEQAKKASMPAASIQNLLKQSKDSKTGLTSYVISLKGPGGSVILINLLTNNLKMSKAYIQSIVKKTIFTISDGNWNHIFTHRGIVETNVPKDTSSDDMLGHALDVGAEDVAQLNNDGEDFVQFLCDPKHLQHVKVKLEELGYSIRLAHCEYIPSIQIVPSETDLESVQYLYKKLEDNQDITGIYDNFAWND